MAIRAWRPVDSIDTNQYLYHYTTMEKAYNILCSNELWFSDLTSTNDMFENTWIGQEQVSNYYAFPEM